MSHINVGAYIDGKRCPTKKALKDALKSAPDTVTFDGTSPMGPQFTGPASAAPEGDTLSVCGPDPYTSRKWFASVKRTGDGYKVA